VETDLLQGRGAGRAIGDQFGQIRHSRRAGGETKKVAGRLDVRPLWRRPDIIADELSVPNDDHRGFARLGRGEKAAVVAAGHGRRAFFQQRGRLGGIVPPDDRIADGLQFAKGDPQPPVRAQQIVHLPLRHAFRQKGPFQQAVRGFLHRPISRKTVDIEEILHPPRLDAGKSVVVIGQHLGVHILGNGAGAQAQGGEVLLDGNAALLRENPLMIKGVQEPLLAGLDRLILDHIDHIPVFRAGARRQFVQRPLVCQDPHRSSRRFAERREQRPPLGRLVGPAPGNDREGGVRHDGATAGQQPQEQDREGDHPPCFSTGPHFLPASDFVKFQNRPSLPRLR